jgi:hypothetical protein
MMNRRKLNSLLPEGVSVGDMSGIPPKTESLNSFIKRYEYEIKGGHIKDFHGFLSQTEIMLQREKTLINIRSFVEEAQINNKDTVHLVVVDQEGIKVRLGELLPEVFKVPIEELYVTRVALFGWDNGWVKPLKKYALFAVDSI